jgi:hypothetical protein
MLAKVAIAICSTVTEANKERSMSDSARTGCSVPPNHGRLATGEKRLFGDLKLFEPKTVCPLIAVRNREEC